MTTGQLPSAEATYKANDQQLFSSLHTVKTDSIFGNNMRESPTESAIEFDPLRRVSTISSTRRPSQQRRASYRSVREDWDTPQSFTISRQTDLSDPNPEESYEESCDGADRILRRWKSSKLRGKFQSTHSLTDLKRWFSGEKNWTLNISGGKDDVAVTDLEDFTEKSGLEGLPAEVLDNILSFLGPYDSSETATLSRDLLSCMQVSRSMYGKTITSLYGQISVPHPMMFAKFMNRLRNDPSVGTLVHRLDFSRYSNIGWGRTRSASTEAKNLNSDVLMQCMAVMPNLQEFLVHEHLDDEISLPLLKRLTSMPSLRALDLCACASKSFVEAFTAIAFANVARPIDSQNQIFGQIERLSLHECGTLQEPVFEALMPQLLRLTHLDVAHTLITDTALLSIPHTARLTHLSIAKCTRVTGSAVVKFLTTHPATKNLVLLNLMADSKRYRLLDEEDCATLIPHLPRSLKSLNLGGARINDTHLPGLMPLTRSLEELGLRDAHLSAKGLESIFTEPEDLPHHSEWAVSSLRYLDINGVPELNHRSLQYSLDVLTSEKSLPLEVVELKDNVVEALARLKRPPGHGQWTVQQFGNRGWYVRNRTAGGGDDGARGWKMGARWWGMRKVPMAVGEVGGMYGYYMFKN